ncbi:GGDEF domain-containing protein [Neobacillus rhizophilus]|uniref:GGDEF domain-containing protein n=1 Tax=Neobacillus rhizophilus TaxID=2833579 RepID=A0A942U7E4_9BACI|nr:GGDEF domain-containing protein [Neobacillus rhizophilus]MBS4212304.1 GGDEF domain-containing protein [Neobacillus rhizophilus]MBU8915740.1 GGDEF domain-containing protein [Bacillus sp. FJAT-29953]
MNRQSLEHENIESLKKKITDLEKREKELLKKLDYHTSLRAMVLDALPINVFLEEPDGKTIFANKQACQMNGMKLEDLIGKTVFDFFPKHIAEMNRKMDLEVWQKRDLITCELKAGFKGKEHHMFTGRTIIHVPESGEEYLLGFGLDITELKLAQKQISHMAYHDALTGLPNRWFIKSYLEQYQAEQMNPNEMLGLILLDLDHFKIINDSLGHQAGDVLLQSVADRLKTETGTGNILARFGGDEFIILLPHLNGVEDAVEISQLVLNLMEEPFCVHSQNFKITPSIGISIHPFHGEDINTLIKNADIAMYHSKEKGRNRYSLFTPNMKKQALAEMEKITAAI